MKKVYEGAFVMFQWLPESARFHATSGDSEKALTTLQKIAEENGKFEVQYSTQKSVYTIT